jgi:hypothetical protein
MATVERVTGPSVAPAPLPGARVTARLDSNFAAPVVQGIDKLGGAIQGIMQQEKAKADTASVLEARRKLSDWERTWFDPANPEGIYASKGRDALGLVDKVAPDFERVQSELVGNLHSDAARNAFLAYADSRRDSLLDRVNGYAVQEHDGYVKAEFQSALLNSTETAARAALEGRFDDQAKEVSTGLQTIRAQAVVLGESADVTQQKETAFTSAVHTTAINGMLGAGDTDGAAVYLDANADDMTAEDLGQARARLRPSLVDAAVQRAVDGIKVGVPAEATGANLTVDAVWDHQIHQESGGRQSAVSNKGAVGAAQIMPTTGPIAARYAGVAWDPERFKSDKGYNLLLGRAYMDAQMDTFGSVPLALAAYNAGPGAVQKWIARLGDPRKGEIAISDFVASIPFKETREYVQRITSRAGGGSGGSGGVGAKPSDVPAGGSAPPAVNPPATFADQMAWADSFADKDVRNGIKAELRSRHAVEEEAKRATDEATLERIHTTIESVEPGTNFQKAFGSDPAIVAYVTQHGLRDQVDNWLLSRAKRELQQTDPLAYDKWDKLRTYQPSEFVKQKVEILADPNLSTQDRREFLASIATLSDPKKKDAAQADYATDNQRLQDAARRLGWSQLPKGEGAKRGAVLGQAVRQAEKAFIQTQNRKPTPAEKDELVRGVTNNFARDMVDGEAAPLSVVQARGARLTAYENAAGALSANRAVRAKAQAGAQRYYGHPPSEAELIAYAVKFGLLAE